MLSNKQPHDLDGHQLTTFLAHAQLFHQENTRIFMSPLKCPPRCFNLLLNVFFGTQGELVGSTAGTSASCLCPQCQPRAWDRVEAKEMRQNWNETSFLVTQDHRLPFPALNSYLLCHRKLSSALVLRRAGWQAAGSVTQMPRRMPQLEPVPI